MYRRNNMFRMIKRILCNKRGLIGSSTAAAIALATGGVQAIGQIQEGQQRSEAELFNADVLRQESKLAQTRGRLSVLKQRKSQKTFSSTQTALFAKAGVEATGSPLKVIEDSFANAELDILTTEFNTQQEVNRKLSEADRRVETAKAERTSGFVRAGKTLLGTAASAAIQFGGIKIPKSPK